MGNAQSDQGETNAWQYIKHIPIVNVGYAPIRAAVYAGKKNKKEADLSGLDFASSIVDTATCFIPGVGPAMKGATVAARVGATAAVAVAGGAAQGGIEYGIDKGRDMVKDGKMNFDADSYEEAGKVVSWIPGGNLVLNGIRAGRGDLVENSDWVESATTTAAWGLPMPSDFRGVRKAMRTADPLIPDAQGLNSLRGKGTRIPAKAVPLDAAEIVAVPAGLNLGGQAATLLPSKISTSTETLESQGSDRNESAALFSSGDGHDKSDEKKSWVPDVVRDNSDAILVTVAVAVVAGTAYYIYRWWTKDKEEKATEEEREMLLQSTS